MARTKNAPNRTTAKKTGIKNTFIKIRCTEDQKALIKILAAADKSCEGNVSRYFLQSVKLSASPPIGIEYDDLEILD